MNNSLEVNNNMEPNNKREAEEEKVNKNNSQEEREMSPTMEVNNSNSPEPNNNSAYSLCTPNNSSTPKKAVTFSEDNYVVIQRHKQLHCSDQQQDDDNNDETSTVCDDSGFDDHLDVTYDEIPGTDLQDEVGHLLQLRPLFFEVPAAACSLQTQHALEAVEERLAAPAVRGVVLCGPPASGKTSTILDLVLRSRFGRPDNKVHPPGGRRTAAAGRLASEVVAYHFLEASDPATLDIGLLVESLAAQLSQHPALSAYRDRLLADPSLTALLTPAALRADPDRGLVEAVLQPLADLYRKGAIPLRCAIILVDSLQEGEGDDEEEDDGDDDDVDCEDSLWRKRLSMVRRRRTVASFLSGNLLKLPHWLKLVCTVDTGRRELVELMHLPQVHLGGEQQDEAVLRYIESRLFSRHPSAEARILAAFEPLRRPRVAARLVSLLVRRSAGPFLYPRLVLDLLEAGSLVLKSEALTVIPRNLAEVLQLYFSLRFPSSAAYSPVADLFAVCLASVEPRSLAQVYDICTASLQQSISYMDFARCYSLIGDLLVTRSDGSLMFHHDLITAWLTGPEAGRFRVIRSRGHDLLLRWLALQDDVSSRLTAASAVLEFVHHLAGCRLFYTEAVYLTVPEVKSLYLNFKVKRQDLVRAARQLSYSQFSSCHRMQQLFDLASGAGDVTASSL